MIETYSESIDEIDELGGGSNTATSSTVVCDRCGFAFPRTKLTRVDGLELCKKCIDEE